MKISSGSAWNFLLRFFPLSFLQKDHSHLIEPPLCLFGLTLFVLINDDARKSNMFRNKVTWCLDND
jgi:hypothetical protein